MLHNIYGTCVKYSRKVLNATWCIYHACSLFSLLITIFDLVFILLHLQKFSVRDFSHYKVSQWVTMNKLSLCLIFVLQIYVYLESLKEVKDFLVVLFNKLSTMPWFILLYLARNHPVIQKNWYYFKIIYGLFQLFTWLEASRGYAPGPHLGGSQQPSRLPAAKLVRLLYSCYLALLNKGKNSIF